MTTEFKQALDHLEKIRESKFQGCDGYGREHIEDFAEINYEAIRRALLIADALMGEPSHRVVQVGVYSRFNDNKAIIDVFKAMRDQMLKEIK
jgi:hypothetical protein